MAVHGRRRAIKVLYVWLLGLLGAHGGAALGFWWTAVRLEDRDGYAADVNLWLLVLLVLVAATAVTALTSGLGPVPATLVAVGAAAIAAALPVEYRSPGQLSQLGLGVLLASPMILMGLVLLVNGRGSTSAASTATKGRAVGS